MSHRLARLLAALALVSLAVPALAEPGLRLSWDHCAADGRVANKAFACNTNAGSDQLVASFESPVGMPDCVGLEPTLHIQSSNDVLPPWWNFAPSACRTSGLGYEYSPAAAGGCAYAYHPNVSGGAAGDLAGRNGPGSLVVRSGVWARIDEPFAILPGTEYFAFTFLIRHSKTVGSNTCSGCSVPVCLGFGSLVMRGRESADVYLHPDGVVPGGGDLTVTWQGAYVQDYWSYREPGVGEVAERATLTCHPDQSVSARRPTWGTIKSLYR